MLRDDIQNAIKDSMTGFLTNSNDSFLHAANIKLVLISLLQEMIYL